MRGVLLFIFILFLEITCGIILAFLYWLLSSLLFDKNGFGHSRVNELIYYLVILFPPGIYCWLEYSRFKRQGMKSKSIIYLSACIAYLAGGLVYLMILTDFYIIGN